MENTDLEQLKYPVGKFQKSDNFEEEKQNFIKNIEEFPSKLANVLANLSEKQLDTPYRPEGWTIRQVVHHCADSHMNAFIRFKLATTEENPIVKGYEEQLWALAADYQGAIDSSLAIIKNLHERWVILIKNMKSEDFKRTYVHSQTGKQADLEYMLSLYSWHCRHHLGHVLLVAK